jgi:phospholipid/cholesterol/gamma-HCH transport system ATP-binding protein
MTSEPSKAHQALAEGTPVLSVQGLRKSYGDRVVLRDVSFELMPGQVLVVMGPSGCGKSTLMRCLIGAQPIDAGEVAYFGQHVDLARSATLDELRLRLGVLFQSGALFSSLTVGENVAFPLRRHARLPERTIEIIVRLKLNQVGLSHAKDLLPSEISGGMVKRAALARAIALDPQLLYCDEPSAGLDPITVAGIDKLLLDLVRALDVSLVVVTHEMSSAFRIADQMIMLHEGNVLARGTPDEIRASEDPRVQQFIRGDSEGPIDFTSASKDLGRSLLEDLR